ncbi:hypothetical protein IWZ01DRAFT_479969 [Phyllosticta capitalensis]
MEDPGTDPPPEQLRPLPPATMAQDEQDHSGCEKTATNPDAKLDRIPADLLFEIDDHLDNTSALSFRLTCCRTRTAFTPLKRRMAKISNPPSIKSLRLLLIRDAMEAEKSGRVRIEDALQAKKEGRQHPGLMQPCFSCNAFHRIECFSMKQLQDPTRNRLCLGHERKLKLCSHEPGYSFYDLVEPTQRLYRREESSIAGANHRISKPCHCEKSISMLEIGPRALLGLMDNSEETQSIPGTTGIKISAKST